MTEHYVRDPAVLTFKQLSVGQSFDFIDDRPGALNSYHQRCRKVGARRYEAVGEGRLLEGTVMQVGSINAEVFHVGGPTTERGN